MSHQDLFVAAVAVGVGVFLLCSAVFQWEWAYHLDSAEKIEGRWGRSAARWYFLALGVFVLSLAGAIIRAAIQGAQAADRRPAPLAAKAE